MKPHEDGNYSIEEQHGPMTDPDICATCKRPHQKRCEGGELYYSDGSSSVCQNWNKRLDEIGGMTPQEADEAERYRSLFL